MEVVIIKGFGSSIGSLLIALLLEEQTGRIGSEGMVSLLPIMLGQPRGLQIGKKPEAKPCLGEIMLIM
jgi:hypothetical protein